MGLADPGRTQENDALGPLDEAEPRELPDDPAINAWLEAEVELLDHSIIRVSVSAPFR